MIDLRIFANRMPGRRSTGLFNYIDKTLMADNKRIKTALVSVFHKDGLDELLSLLHNHGVKFLSTGGTKSFIDGLGYECEAVEDLTGYPSILGGRVKTLHPKVFGGILNRRDNAGDQEQIKQYEIPEIDLVIVDLYPFEETVASGASEADIIEKIDIGGISLIRAAAKNYNDVVIVASKQQYAPLCEILKQNGDAVTSLADRRFFAKEAFGVSSAYDSAIFNYFDAESDSDFRVAINGSRHLRYGENPHQAGKFFGDFDKMFEQLHGKEISYNNLLDIDAAVNLIGDFDETTAEEMHKIFFEVCIAPSYTKEALAILEQKKNRIILLQKSTELPTQQFRSILNGVLRQDKDLRKETTADLKQATEKAITAEQAEDLLFANKVVKHSKSNAIVLAKGKQLFASGIGQTSRVDAHRQAIEKAKSFNYDLHGAVMASDAFFPFADCVEIAHNEGITAVIQPGGSIRDNETVDFCNKNGIAMVMTGIRHFKH